MQTREDTTAVQSYKRREINGKCRKAKEEWLRKSIERCQAE